MRLIPWLRSLTSQSTRPRPRRARLLLEALEDRTVPSTFQVTNLHDSGPGSLRAAVMAANTTPGPDLIKFADGLKGTITLASELSITDDLTIHGNRNDDNDHNPLTVSGGNSTRVFHVSGSATHLAIDNLTIANGRASVPAGTALGGGLLNDGASVSLAQVVFASNQAIGSGAGGGAVANIGGAHFTAEDTDFLGNTASGANTNFGDGGAVYDDQKAVVDIEDGTFSGNLATGGNANGGAIGHYGGSQLTLDDCSFDDNQIVALFPGSPVASAGEDAAGGAIESDQSISGFFGNLGQPTMTIAHCSFTDNVARAATSPAGQGGGSGEGGALAVEDGAKATVSDSTFDSNRARGGDGGAGSARMDGGAGGGSAAGALFNASGILTVSDSLFRGNEARGGNGGKGGAGGNGGAGAGFTPGGAIDATALGGNVAPTTTLDDCRFVDNRATGGDGGAGGSGGNGGNGTRGDGGAIINFLGTMTVRGSSLVDNTAQGGAGGAPGSGVGTVGGVGGLGRGGGFSNELGGTATLTDSSIIDNQASGGTGAAGGNGGNAVGGGVYNGRFLGQPATLELSDCTVRANLATGGAGGLGGNGGDALGGGIFNGNTTATGGLITSPGTYPILDLDDTKVTANQASGGAAGSGGVAGAGVGGGLYNQGGGLYNQAGAVAEADAHTRIKRNEATTSDDDIFGTVTPS